MAKMIQQTKRKPSMSTHSYGSTWRKLRATILRQRPLCAECEKQGKLVKAQHLDHIRPHKGDMALFYDPDNLQGLCHSCHSRKTAQEDGGFGNAPSDKPSKACGVDGIPTDGRHHWRR